MQPSKSPESSAISSQARGAALEAMVAPSNPVSPLPLSCTLENDEFVTVALGQSDPVTPRLPASPAPVAIGLVLAQALRSRWESYREHLRHCQRHFSEEAVHQLRVATRRLLASLSLLGAVTPSATLEKSRRMLKRHLASLGDLRDAQVQRLYIEQKAVRFPELVLVRRWLQRREHRLATEAADSVHGFKTRKLERWIAGLSDGLAANVRNPRVQRHLNSAVLHAAGQAFDEAVERRRAIDVADARTIHQTRVAFKRFRYTVESLSPEFTGLSRRQLRALAYYQRRMGIIQDLEVMRACLDQFIRGDAQRDAHLQPFSRHLRQHRARALRSFLKTADRLYQFWPPAELAARGDMTPAPDAA
jgi:CHAD domain-containing protein